MKNVNWARRLAVKEALRRIANAISYNNQSELVARNPFVRMELERKGFRVNDAAQEQYMEVSW